MCKLYKISSSSQSNKRVNQRDDTTSLIMIKLEDFLITCPVLFFHPLWYSCAQKAHTGTHCIQWEGGLGIFGRDMGFKSPLSRPLILKRSSQTFASDFAFACPGREREQENCCQDRLNPVHAVTEPSYILPSPIPLIHPESPLAALSTLSLPPIPPYLPWQTAGAPLTPTGKFWPSG